MTTKPVLILATSQQAASRFFSYVEHRYYCTTCRHTFSEDKHTFFETVRSPRPVVLEALALLNERNSLRAGARLTQHSPNRILPWLDLAGRHAAAVSRALIRDLHLTQVPIDELGTFVKKNKPTVSPLIRRKSATWGCGGRWRCRAGCG